MTRVDLVFILVNTLVPTKPTLVHVAIEFQLQETKEKKLKTQYNDWNHGDSNLIITSWLSRFIYLSRDWSMVIIQVETKVHSFNMSTLFK